MGERLFCVIKNCEPNKRDEIDRIPPKKKKEESVCFFFIFQTLTQKENLPSQSRALSFYIFPAHLYLYELIFPPSFFPPTKRGKNELEHLSIRRKK